MFLVWYYLMLNVIKKLSRLRREPDWLLCWRLNAYYSYCFIKEPDWSYAKQHQNLNIKLCLNFIPIMNLCSNVDVILNSNSVYLNLSKELKCLGVFFTSLSKACLIFAVYVRRYLGFVVSVNDNYYSALNSAFFTDGSFIRIPAFAGCPGVLSSYFKVYNVGFQFERTLILSSFNSKLNYFEGCNSNLNCVAIHAAVVEIVIQERASVKYTTLQNWSKGSMGILNFVTKRAVCFGKLSKIVWVQIELGASVTWKYPSSVLFGKFSRCEFYSFNVSNFSQIVDTGTKILYFNSQCNGLILTRSVLIGKCVNTFRSLILFNSEYCKCVCKCDSLILNKDSLNLILPYVNFNSKTSLLNYESVTSYITYKQLLYCKQRGINQSDALKLIFIGFSYEITKRLPFEIFLELNKLLNLLIF